MTTLINMGYTEGQLTNYSLPNLQSIARTAITDSCFSKRIGKLSKEESLAEQKSKRKSARRNSVQGKAYIIGNNDKRVREVMVIGKSGRYAEVLIDGVPQTIRSGKLRYASDDLDLVFD